MLRKQWVIKFTVPPFKDKAGQFPAVVLCRLAKPFSRHVPGLSKKKMTSTWASLSEIKKNKLSLLKFDSRSAASAFVLGEAVGDAISQDLASPRDWYQIVRAPR